MIRGVEIVYSTETSIHRSAPEKLMDDMALYHSDPHGFVMFAFPWGEEGLPLAEETGPDGWQTQILTDIGHALKHGWVMNNGVKKDCTAGIYIAVASGHGIGKSALMAMLELWFNSVHPSPQIVTTANTKEQLTSKTGRELSKWHKMAINTHWFEKTATRLTCLAEPDTWFSSMIPWSENKPEAFAGTHEKYVMIKYDEASAIPDIIWETTEGAMTEANGIKIWVVFGNPTKNTGRFKECFGKDRNRWLTYQVDARTSKRTDDKLFKLWEDLYGEDSDFFRVRVKGQFPRASSAQFIGSDIVDTAAGKVYHPSVYIHAKRILGVDIARFGDDKTVFIRKQGLQMFGIKKFSGLDAMRCAGLIAEEIKDYEPDMVFLDMGNIGAAVYDILVSWGYRDVLTGVWFGAEPDDKKMYFNKRVEMWGRLRVWMKNGGAIPDDNELKDDLIGPEYGFSHKEQIQLEGKKDMKNGGLASPDIGDAAAVCFAYEVVEKAERDEHLNTNKDAVTDYALFGTAPSQEKGQGVTGYDIFNRPS